MSDWSTIPKIELHLHLEGAAPPALVRELAAEKKIDLSGVFDDQGRYPLSDFTTFLRTYERIATVFETPDDYRRLTEAVLAECARSGVVYAEIFLSPTSLGYDPASWADYQAGIEAGADAAEATHGIVCRFIPVIVRHHGPDKAPIAAQAILGAPRGRMTGFGMAGDERLHSASDFAPVFAEMAEAGFRLTCHAGEFGGPDSVRGALSLGVERIGHGVRSAEDPDLVAEIVDRGVTLECCPGSNVALGVYPSLAAHSFDELRRAGARVTISTDDPPFFHTDMRKEYETLAAAFGYDAADFRQMSGAALEAAFCDAPTKAAIKARLDAAV